MTTKLKLKPDTSDIGLYNVYLDGKQIAKFWFCRNVRTIAGRRVVVTTGLLTDLRTGETKDLRTYWWFADVRKDLSYLLGFSD